MGQLINLRISMLVQWVFVPFCIVTLEAHWYVLGKAPFALLFSIRVSFHFSYIGNSFFKAYTYQGDYHGGS